MGGEIEARGKWSKTEVCGVGVEFMLSCIGYAVGLGNVWRFPYRMAQNGGGAFLIPYLIMLLCCGIPLCFLELAYGQYSGLGAISAWASVPAFKGIGYSMVFVSWIVTIYYNLVIAYAIYYLCACFQKVLPWTKCRADWNTDLTALEPLLCSDLGSNFTYTNATGFSSDKLLPAAEYWYRGVLRTHESTGMLDPGRVLWDVTLSNLAAWLIVFFCLIKGIQSSGKVVYFTATFPYLVLFILFCAGIWREGAGDGVKFYLGVGDPDLIAKMSKPSAWTGAASQIFYSIGVGFGGLLTFASYNKFNNNIRRDTLLICLINCGTSFFAGFVIFGIIGHMAHLLKQPVASVADAGPGLAFIAYPSAMTLMPASHLWCILFFIMLITLGLDSQYAMVETCITSITDFWPQLRSRKSLVVGVYCIVNFLLGIPMTSTSGAYWFYLVENYSAWVGFIMIGLFMVIAIHMIYGNLAPKFLDKTSRGWGRLRRDLRMMMGSEASIITQGYMYYMEFMWWIGVPVLLMFVIVKACMYIGDNPDITMSYKFKTGTYKFPAGGVALSHMMNFGPQFICVLVFIYELWKVKWDVKKTLIPTKDWHAQAGATATDGHYADSEVKNNNGASNLGFD